MNKIFKSFLLLLLLASTVLTQPFYLDVVDWKFKTDAPIYATATVHENVVYVGSLDGSLYALNADSGEQVWSFKTGEPVQSQPVIANDVILFESGNVLYALDLTGAEKWRFTLCDGEPVNQIDSWDFHHSSPVVIEDVVYISSEKGLVFGVNIESGQSVFNVQTPTQETIRTTPGIYQNKLFVGDWIGVVHVYDLSTQELVWSYDTRNDNTYGWTNIVQKDFAFLGDAVFFSGRSCNAYSLNVNDGSRNWLFNEPNLWIVGGPTLDDSTVYFGSSNQRHVYALDAVNGELKWRANTDGRLWGPPLVIEDELFFGCNSFFGISKHDGSVQQKLFFDADSCHPPEIDLTFMGGTSKAAGSSLSNFHPSPILHDGKIIIGCDDGYLYAFNLEAFLTIKNPKTILNDDTTLQLGEIDSNQNIDLELKNTGEGTDLLYITWANSKIPSEAVEISHGTVCLNAHDSLAVSLKIYPAFINPGKYTLTFRVSSKASIEPNTISKRIKFTVPEISSVNSNPAHPNDFSLKQNYPNPFNPVTTINFTLPKSEQVLLNILNVKGELVDSLNLSQMEKGYHSISWNGINFPSGVYFYKIITESFSDVKKMLLIK